MKSYITIDGGTTNTRLRLMKNATVIETIKLPIGAKAGIDNHKFLILEIKKAISDLGKHRGIERILASGMITSELGLYNLPHIAAPAGIKELHNAICEVTLDSISPIPFAFVPGVKVSDGTLEGTDMMRGEETEIVGLKDYGSNDCLYVLPGSHSKIIQVDSNGRICDFHTMLTGEMISALACNTILKNSVSLEQDQLDDVSLLDGYNFCKTFGMNEALFKTRVLKNIFQATDKQAYSFFLGVVLQPEIKRITDNTLNKVVIGGRTQIKNAMYELLKQICDKEIILVPDERASIATALGMVKIYEFGEMSKNCRLCSNSY